jgi:hypothetical protein
LLAANLVLVLEVPLALIGSDLLLVCGPPSGLLAPISFRVDGPVLAGGFPLSFPYYFQVRSAACVLVFLLIFPEAFQAPAGAHVALCDVAVPAGLAGEVALQVERFWLHHG